MKFHSENSRTFSDKQESDIRAAFAKAGVEFKILDKSSGGARQDGDGMSPTFFLSCKFRQQGSFALAAKDFARDVLLAEKWHKTPIWALRNGQGTDIIAMRIDDFMAILTSALETLDE